MRTTTKGRTRSIVKFWVIRFLCFAVIVAFGLGVMLFSDNVLHLIFLGTVYIIVLLAFVVVVLADVLDAEIQRKLSKAC